MDVARRASQLRFEQIAGTSPDGIICADRNGRITFWNAAAERLFGYSTDEAHGQSIDLIVPERLGRMHDGSLQRVADGAPPRLVGKLVELSARHKDGGEFPIELSLSMWMEPEGPAFGAIVRDVRERRANEERLYQLAHLDPLTALPNRTVLQDRIGTAIRHGNSASVLIVDVDGFKGVNDTFGHAAGDAVLREVARRLVACSDPGETVSRLGGDEFALLLPGIDAPLRSTLTADAIVRSLSEPFHIEGRTLRLGASVGIAIAPSHGKDASAVLASADMALYRAKLEGRRCSRLYTPELREVATRQQRCRDELHGAVERGEFVLLYQPQVRLKDGALVGAEALIRWQHPQHGLLAPAAFLGTLEAGPHAAQVGDWVLRTACAQARTWREAGQSEFQIGVNLSASQFRGGNLASRVRDTLTEIGLPASALELEITETIILSNDLDIISSLRQIRSMGAGVSFDDYGTGYASLSLLKRFPLTRLKIDRSFVTGMGSSREDLTIICAIIRLARGFGLNVIAEGIETEAECERLRAKGCKEGQGYLFGKPMTADNFGLQFGIIKLNGSQNANMAA